MREALAQAEVVTVRERGARQILEDIGVHVDIAVTADPALLLKPEPVAADVLKREGLDTKKPLVGMSVREPGAAAPEISESDYHQLLADVADFMVDRYDADIIFVPMEPNIGRTPSSATRSPRRCCARRARACSRATIPRGSC